MAQSLFIKTLQERGFIHQCSDLGALDNLMSKGVVPSYIGFDATADSLHVGSLLPIMMLRHLQNAGHKPVVLMGGGTTRVGDPTGKDARRKMLTEDDIANNMAGIKKIFEQFLSFGEGETDAVMVDNYEWLKNINYLEFLRDYGKHFTINRMLSFESVKLRLSREQPLSFLEFNYMLLQGYDFMHLQKEMNCSLQMGGSDQWGNIINGIELSRRVNSAEVYGLTTSLLTTASGGKMGKTEGGAVWLNKASLSDFDYWQFWRNTEDADVCRFLRLFTELPLDEIAKLEALEGADINSAKIVLANEATAMCRGVEASTLAQETANTTFAEGGLGVNLPTIEKTQSEIDDGLGILAILTEFGFTASNGEARRQVQGGGVKINNIKVEDVNVKITADDIIDGVLKLSLGKKKHGIVKVK